MKVQLCAIRPCMRWEMVRETRCLSMVEERVIETLERMYNDEDLSVRKKARKMLNTFVL